MPTAIAPRLTAAQVILLAAEDLTAGGSTEFTEWDLTMASWARDRARFGLRGYDQKHPDHKRVMMEIMGRKPQNPLTQGFMEKVRPNVYRLTPLGRAEVARLRGGRDAGGGAPVRAGTVQAELHRLAAAMLAHPAFEQWRLNPDRPRQWDTAAAFLSLVGDPRRDPAGCVAALRRSARAAIDWCMAHDVVYLTPSARATSEPIHIRLLTELTDFLQVLEYRFPDQLEARPAGKAGK
jgi:hypothetical protein